MCLTSCHYTALTVQYYQGIPQAQWSVSWLRTSQACQKTCLPHPENKWHWQGGLCCPISAAPWRAATNSGKSCAGWWSVEWRSYRLAEQETAISYPPFQAWAPYMGLRRKISPCPTEIFSLLLCCTGQSGGHHFRHQLQQVQIQAWFWCKHVMQICRERTSFV